MPTRLVLTCFRAQLSFGSQNRVFPGSLVIPVTHSSRARSCIGAKPLKRNLASSESRRPGWFYWLKAFVCDIISRFSIIELSIMTKADTDT